MACFHYLDYSLIAIAVLQVLVVGGFVVEAATGSKMDTIIPGKATTNPLVRIRRAWCLTTGQKANLLGITDVDEFHRRSVDTFFRQRSDALFVGSLGFAGWAVLSGQKVTSLRGDPLDLLLTGVVLSLLAPLVIRSGPLEGSYVAMLAFLGVGYAGIAFAVIAASAVTFDVAWVTFAAIIAGPAFVVVEGFQLVSELKRTALFLRP